MNATINDSVIIKFADELERLCPSHEIEYRRCFETVDARFREFRGTDSGWALCGIALIPFDRLHEVIAKLESLPDRAGIAFTLEAIRSTVAWY